MNGAHFHMVVNHLPIIFPIVGLIVLLTGLVVKSEPIKRVGFFVFILGAISNMPAFASGEGAEEMAEGLPGVTEHLIHEHEEKAEFFGLMNYLLGLISLVALWLSWKQNAIAKWVALIALIFAPIVITLAKSVGTSGGEIRHTEIRKDKTGKEPTSSEADEE